jgi:hypothetical protein
MSEERTSKTPSTVSVASTVPTPTTRPRRCTDRQGAVTDAEIEAAVDDAGYSLDA